MNLREPLDPRRTPALAALAAAIALSGFQIASHVMGVPFRGTMIFYLLAGIAALAYTPMMILQVVRLVQRLRTPITHPPGWNLHRLAELCFSKKTYTKVLEPALSDMQKEHFEALAAGRSWKARMVLVRGYWSFWSAVAAQLPISLARRVYEVWKATKTGS